MKLTVADIKEQRIQTLGIPKSYECHGCGKRQQISAMDEMNLAECIVANSAGMWGLHHCRRCAWVNMIYPTRINGVKCTNKECDKLQKEMESYTKAVNEAVEKKI